LFAATVEQAVSCCVAALCASLGPVDDYWYLSPSEKRGEAIIEAAVRIGVKQKQQEAENRRHEPGDKDLYAAASLTLLLLPAACVLYLVGNPGISSSNAPTCYFYKPTALAFCKESAN